MCVSLQDYDVGIGTYALNVPNKILYIAKECVANWLLRLDLLIPYGSLQP